MGTAVVPSNKKQGTIAILFAALLWSTGGLFIKLISLDAWGVSFWRSLFAAITLWTIYKFRFRNVQSPKTHWRDSKIYIIAFFYALLLVLFVLATKLTTSANAIFLQYTAPVYILFAEPIISKLKIRLVDMVLVALSIGAMGLF